MDINWNNTTGARIVIDCWEFEGYSYAIILYPSNILRLQWVKINE
jgi:hypothetical protein